MAVQPLPEMASGVMAPTFDGVMTEATQSRLRRQRLARNLELYLPLGGVVFMILFCFLGPVVLPVLNPVQSNILATSLPPLSPGHFLGTDPVGYDIFARILYGGRVSLEVGFGAQATGVILGSAIGMFAAFKGGITETFIMRCMDLLLAFPGLVIAITIATYLGPSEVHVIWAISFFTVPGMARLSRAQTLRLREQDFVVSSRLYGQKDRWILTRHLAPNVYPNLLTFICLGIGFAIVAEAGLSFLGLGVPPPTPSWGNMISEGQDFLANDPYLIIIPAIFLFFTIMCLNLLGDAIRGEDLEPMTTVNEANDASRLAASAATTSSDHHLLEVENLHVEFHRRGRVVYAVNGVDYTLDSDETLAVIGESGSGKTVSSRAILGLLPNYAQVTGSIRFDGKQLLGLSEEQLRPHRGADVAMVFQDSGRSLNPTMRVGTQISEAIRVHLPMSKKEAKDRAIELLQMVRLPAAEQRYFEYPHQLSGGMRQRVMTAMALSCNPRVLIADEATTALDVTTQAQIMDMLLELQSRFHMGLIVISHDMGLAASFTQNVIVMYAGRVVEQAPTKDLFAHVHMPYTRVLLDAIPRIDRPAHSRLPVVQGRPPDLTTLPRGCSFNPRCPYVQERCREETPPLDGDASHQWACFFPLEREVTSV